MLHRRQIRKNGLDGPLRRFQSSRLSDVDQGQESLKSIKSHLTWRLRGSRRRRRRISRLTFPQRSAECPPPLENGHAKPIRKAWPQRDRQTSRTPRQVGQRLHRLRRLEPKKPPPALHPRGRVRPAFNHLNLCNLWLKTVLCPWGLGLGLGGHMPGVPAPCDPSVSAGSLARLGPATASVKKRNAVFAERRTPHPFCDLTHSRNSAIRTSYPRAAGV